MSSKACPVSGHPDFQQEKNRLTNTIQAMKETVPELENAGCEINPWDTDVDIRSKQMVAAYKRKKARALSENLGVPYFGRVDYLEEGLYDPEQLYVGRVGFNGAEEVQVVDWRAPKATVFYECQGGQANYTVRDETYYGEVSLKRQYQIDNGVLENFFDDQVLNTLTMELPGDGLDQVLRKRLEEGTENRLKDIVETIRSEQNKVIREPLEQITIVQGTAGSGKSTVALHRVSYLLYNYQSLEPHKVAVIAPNKLFLDYISAVLPGLDLQEIRQFTLTDLAETVLESPLEVVVDLETIDHELGQQALYTTIENFIRNISDRFVSSIEDIQLYQGRLLIGRGELVKKFQEGNNPLHRRLDSLKKYLEFRINYFLETSDLYFDQKVPAGISKSLIKGYVQRVKDNYEQEFFKARSGVDKVTRLERNREIKENLARELQKIEREKTEFLAAFGLVLPYQDIWQVYCAVNPAAQALEQEQAAEGGQVSLRIRRKDIAPLCLLKYLLDGFSFKYQHLVVDEAQDLSSTEFAVLKLLARNSFTILGDLAQGIFGESGLESWEVLQQEVFKGQSVKFHLLKQSYRSTKEIVEFANKVLPPELPKGIPVYRQGEEPKVEETSGPKETAQKVRERIDYFLEKGCKSVAVIAKTTQECAVAFDLLREEGISTLNLITEQSTTFPGGITVVPVALAKGLEFDAVLVWDASKDRFSPAPGDAKKLFVALSRPLHFLHVFYSGELSPLLG